MPYKKRSWLRRGKKWLKYIRRPRRFKHVVMNRKPEPKDWIFLQRLQVDRLRVLSIDPSVNHVGWSYCCLRRRNKKWTVRRSSFRWGVFELSANNYQTRLRDLVDHITNDVGRFDFLILEWPTFFNSEKGAIAAHNNYTIDLAGVCQYIAGWFRLDHRRVQRYTPSEWKGTVPKFVSARKFMREFKVQSYRVSEHAIDATMMLKHWLDRMKVRLVLDKIPEFPQPLADTVESEVSVSPTMRLI